MNGTLDLLSLKTVPSNYSWDNGTPGVEFFSFSTNIKQLTAASTNEEGIEYVGYAPFFSVTLSSAPGTSPVSSVAQQRLVDFGDYYNAESNYVTSPTLSYETFCHNYVMPGLYDITFTEIKYVKTTQTAQTILPCLDRYCLNWSWKDTANCALGGPQLTWANTLSTAQYEKLWQYEGCDASWATQQGLYIQPTELYQRYPLSWQWYNFLCDGGLNVTNTPITWAQSVFQGPEQLSWVEMNGPCINIQSSIQGVIWKWDYITCSPTATGAFNKNISWDETKCSGRFNRTWDEIAITCSETNQFSLSSSTYTFAKKAIIRVLENNPIAYLDITDPTLLQNPQSPLTVRLTPRYTKCGSFPIEKIVWDLGDGSPLLVQRRWANNTNAPFSYSGVYNLDYQDPRNYDVVHTYRRTQTGQFTFYPSITAYASSTSTTDCAAITIGPLNLVDNSLLGTNIKLLQNEKTSVGKVLLADIDDTVAIWKVDPLPIIVETPTATPTESPTETPTETLTETPTETVTETSPLSTFFAAGLNSSGELGFGNGAPTEMELTQMSGNWSFIVPGQMYTFALSGNKLFATGYNSDGQLGLGDNVTRKTFTEVPGNWNAVACNNNHSLALSGNKLFATGYNYYGQLGLGDNVARNAFTEVPGNWDAVACGYFHSFALSGNKLFATGQNALGQLGLGHNTNRNVFTEVSGDWDSVKCGVQFSFALSGNKLFATGTNSYGQLGLGHNTNRNVFTEVSGNWDKVAPGRMETYALSGTKLFATGYNFNGDLGLGDTTNRNEFAQLSGDWNDVSIATYGLGHVVALSGNKLFGLGQNWALQLSFNGGNSSDITGFFEELSGNWSQAVCGGYNTFALSS